MAQSANKLVGTQYLDLSRLKNDVAETNKLLQSIGAGVNLNMTDVVEKQVKSVLTRFKNEVQSMASQTAQAGQQASSGLRPVNTQMQALLSTTQRLAKDGSLTETRKGFDALGNTITEVYQAGQLLNRTVATDSALNKDIKYANELYQQQITALRTIYSLRTQRQTVRDDTQTAQALDTQIADSQKLVENNRQMIALLDQQAVSRSKLVDLAAEETVLQQKYAAAQAVQQDKLSAKEFSGANELCQVKELYAQLTQAQRNYIVALKNKDAISQNYWAQNIQQASGELRALEQKLGSLNIEEGTRRKILSLIQQAKDAEQSHTRNVDNLNATATNLDKTLDRIGTRLLQMAATMVVLRGQTTIWREAIDYAQKYYDKLNEIQIVTGKSDAAIQKMGQNYRKLAAQMSVTSTEIAEAAVEFWRQGLDEAEVNSRLKAATQYAKISSIAFEESAELVTAATNTMEIGAQRVVDVFAYLGDASASGADEIGIAMQKASASAMEFGVSFEWLGAYIATISEKTRQAPEVIGTSLNSIMARLHSIKAKGFNEEDATKINDIAKALGTLETPIKLIDEETGKWRDMPVIFEEIARQWNTLDAKQRAYISTTMAGTRQQNYFLALMSDMAKGAEGGSRAFELYEGAMTAAGTAASKYAVWQESVTAAQNRLTAATQDFYALLNAEWMKNFYDGMADIVNIVTAGTDAMNGWNIIVPVAAAGIAALIAVTYKAVTAFKALQVAMAAGQGAATLLSGGTIAAISAALGVIALLVTSVVGASSAAAKTEKIDYSGTAASVASYRDNISSLTGELEAQAAKTELTAEEQARAEDIMRILSGTSLSMKAALEGGGEGFDTLGQKAAAARGEVEKTEQVLRSLNAADALQNLRDSEKSYADAIHDAQQALKSSSQYGDIAGAYAQYMSEHPSGLYTQGYSGPMGSHASKEENFYVYAKNQSNQPKPIWQSTEEKARIQADRDFWAVTVAEMDKLGIDYSSSVEAISNKMQEFDIAAGTYADANRESLSEAWQAVFDDLYTVMTDGTPFNQLPSFMQDAAVNYFDAYTAAIDQQKQLAEGEFMGMAADLTGYVDQMTAFVEDHEDFDELIWRFDELLTLPQTQESVDELNALLPVINEFIAAYNALTESTDDDIALIPEFSLEDLRDAAVQVDEMGEALLTLNASDIYKDLAMAKEEANGFASVLKRLGDGEGQLTNLHDAVMTTAQEMANALGITDTAAISKMGESLLEGLYDTYPKISDYVDTATGMLLDGWEDGLAHATNPWTEFFDKARMEDALREAQKDMAALDGSKLWEELLSPDGKGLYGYAEDWARMLIPEGTEEEIHAQAESFVDAFFTMFEDIDTEIMGADGRIAAGMDGIIATMRRAVHDAQAEKTKLEDAYQSLHADTIARREAMDGLTAMAGLVQSGDAAGANSTFEALSANAISAITAAMPGQINKLHEGTAAADDFEAAILKLREAENEAGRDAWKGYFDKTAEGLKQQSVFWSNVMRGIIAEVSVAEDKEAAFYQALIRLSNEEVDVSGMLDQYGALGVQLLSGAKSADELYAALIRLENLNGLQVDLENADALTQAAKVIDPAQSGYDPLSALASYDLLEAKYAELMELQRGSAEYIQRARELTDEGTAAVYRQAAAYGVVTDLQAKSAQAAAASQTERTFRHADENAYEGGASYLAKAMREAAVAGEDVKLAWSRALSNLDEAGVLEGMSALFGDISMLAVECGGNVEAIIRRLYEMRDAAQSISLSDVAEELRREREGNTAGIEGYRSQVDELFSAFDDGGMEGVSRAMEVWNSFDESIQQSIAETYPSLVIALDEANRAASALSEGISDLENAEGGLSDSSKATEKKIEALGKELDVAQKNASARYFKNTTRAIEDLKHGTISAADAFGDYNAEAEKAVEANEEYQKASKKMAAGTKVTVDEIDTLAQFLGNIDPSILLANWDQVGPMISSALAEGEAAFDRLNEAAFVTITGTSVADFSALTAGLISVQNLAADAVDALIATGQWTMETITLPQEGAQWDPIAGVWTRTRMNTNQNVLRYNGSNPLRSGSGKSASSGSGGSGKGGGGSSSTSVSKSIEKMLDKMDATVDIEDHRRKMAQLGQNYHETRGEIQGVLKYMELEKQIIQENSTTLEGYVSSLEAQIESQKAILATNKESSSKYKQAMVDLAALQEQHKQYSQTLVQNKIDLEELEKAMKEQQDAIRQMEIDLRDLIHDAILDREDLIKRMLDGQIDLENELIDVLTQRYEKERDEILKLAETKRDALSEELELLDRQLEARRQLNEQQDRAKQLAEKEAQLARISADPTRKKDELALREEIAKLREEIAWELAEEEVDAQKKSIESQMESIDDYMEYVQTYYEELLSNPRRLIEEMQALLTQTDEEILLWLTQNHEDYQAATDATREQMRREWQEMLDDMRGNTKTYWDEVEAIIAQGDQAIIDFLKDNSADYREAGKLQAQAYADEWQKQLDALKAAYKQVSAEIQSYDYTPTTKSSSSSGSSSGSSSSSKKTTTSRFVSSGTGYAEAYIKTATSISYNGSTYVKDPHSNYWYKTSDAKRIDGGRTYYWKTGTTRYVKKYAEGGMAKSTGLAWLDGTEQQPERILSPYQTELFEDMLKTLHAIRTFQAPASVVQPKLPEKASQQGLYIDSITVQVQRLDSDQDYEEMAERVGEHIMERVSRGMAVGGIRIG